MIFQKFIAVGFICAIVAGFAGCSEREISPVDETGIMENGVCTLSQLLPQTDKKQYWIFETYAIDTFGITSHGPIYIDSAVFRGEMQLYGGKMAFPQVIFRSADGGATYSVYDTIYTAYSDGKLYSSHINEEIRDICNCSSQKWTTIADCSGGMVTTRDTIKSGDKYPSIVNGNVFYTSLLDTIKITALPLGKHPFPTNEIVENAISFRASGYFSTTLLMPDTMKVTFTNGKDKITVSQTCDVYYAKGTGIVFERKINNSDATMESNFNKSKQYERRLKKHVIL